MTIAEVHGKISSTGRNLHDQLEDLLTSDVFSACKYVRPQTLLLPFLRTAKSQDGRNLAEALPAHVQQATYAFWPRMTSSEPDLLVVLEDEKGQYFLVVIEAKYFSGKSGGPLGEEELEVASAPSDQLACEFKDLMTAEDYLRIDPQRIANRALVYVTAHRSLPGGSLSESAKEIGHFFPNEERIELYWTSWFNLLPVLSEQMDILEWEVVILTDLKRLMEKKNFLFFNGMGSFESVMAIQDGTIYSSQQRSEAGAYSFHLQPIKPIKIVYSTKREAGTFYDWQVTSLNITPRIYQGADNE